MTPSAYLWLLMALMCVVSVEILVPLVRSGIPGVREAIWANVSTILGAAAMTLQGLVVPFVGVLVPNALIAAGGACLVASARMLAGHRPRWAVLIPAAILLMAVTLYYTTFEPAPSRRIIAASLYLMGVVLSAAWAVASWTWKNPPLRYSHVFMIALALALACVHAACIYVYASGDVHETSTWNLDFLVISIFSGPGLLIALAVMFYDRRLLEYEREVNTDFLTGVLLRKAWWERVERLGRHAHEMRVPLVLMLADLDHFKRINDTRGHAVGDAVLCHFAQGMQIMLRKSDVLGRLGGEEFALALPGARLDEAQILINRIRGALAEMPCCVEDQDISYTFSAGLAAWQPGETLHTALERADRALYRAKLAGRDRIEVGPHPDYQRPDRGGQVDD